MNVVGYIRVSTDEQADKGVSLKVQREKIEAYCNLYNLTLCNVYEDAGESGKSLKRPGIQSALFSLRNKESEGIVVAKLDRLTRSISDWQTLIETYFCERAGKQLFSVTDSIDTRTAAGRLVLNVLLSVAQWERETIGERTKAALRYKMSRQERVGKIGYGYYLADDAKTLVKHPAEQETISIIHTLKQSGYPLRAIANELSNRGITTKEGKAKWSHATVQRILARL
jgi:DNA invertase Pin-like site-specific DNA recombinase